MNNEGRPSSAEAEHPDEILRSSPQCRRGFPTHPFETNGWSGRAAPRSPGQPPTRSDRTADGGGRRIPFRIPRAELEAQSVACTHLVRACRQAIDELSLDSEAAEGANERAVEILREIQTDWSTALKALRRLSRK